MSDEHFLARWSRRKRAVAEEEAVARDASAKPESDQNDEAVSRHAAAADAQPANTASGKPPAPQQPAFDPASLPSLESITEGTDVRGFLNPGVPAALRREALRRAWSADPAIRDFVGLQEYDFDYNTPGAILGFGEVGSPEEVRRLAARVFGETPDDDKAEPASPPPEPTQPSDPTGELVVAEDPAASRSATLSHHGDKSDPPSGPVEASGAEDAAKQNAPLLHGNKYSEPTGDSVKVRKGRRGHGGALPKT